MKKILLLCALLSSFAAARFDCCARKHATLKKEVTAVTVTVGVVNAEDESTLKKVSVSLSSEGIQLQVKKLGDQGKASEALSNGLVDALYTGSLHARPDTEKKEVLSTLKKKLESVAR